MNKYFNVGINLIEDNLKKIKSQLLEYTSEENAKYILENIKIDSDFYISLNKEYKKGIDFKEFVLNQQLDKSILDIFKFNLYKHQENAIKFIKNFKNTVISTGTGSGKTESFIIPILDYCLKNKDKKGTKVIIIYPMNALANDQKRRINDILSKTNLKFAIFTGETPKKKDNQNYDCEYKNQIYYREDIIDELPDILVTNYVMLDRILTSEENNKLIKNSSETLKYVVLDEIHTYRGNKGTHLKFLLDRLRYNVNNELVYVGCSATLSQNKKSKSTKGYLKGNNLDEFILPLFNYKKYRLVQAEYEEIRDIPKNIKNYEEIKIIRDELFKGSKNIEELKIALRRNGFNLDRQELYNLLNDNSDIISFRVYLFLTDIQDGIKRCIKCGKYHVGFSNKCLSCGNLLFYVDTNNPNMMIGKIKNKSLTNYIKFDLNDKKECTFVGIFKDNYQIDDSDLVIKINSQFNYLDENEIEICADEEGDIKLIYLETKPKIFEIEKKQNFFYLAQSIFKNTPIENRKILSFKDNRQEVSRYKNLSNDIFISNTFLELSKYILENKKNCFKEAKSEILNEINLFIENNSNSMLKDIICDFDVWFNRMLRDKSELINIGLIDEAEKDLDEYEKIIIEFFIQERIIDIKPVNEFNTKYINYNLFNLKKYNVACLDEDQINDGLFIKISLSKKGRNIKSFFDSKGINYDSINIIKIIQSLVQKDILTKIITKDKKEVYCLNQEKLYILFGESNYSSIKEVVENNLFIAGVHSSEINKLEKINIERKFQDNKLNLLFSTPTLEMGIDIGGLNIVFMQGIPPLPSNFAQRSGRAGRKDDKEALIVTLCSDISYHDMYYFENPKDIIEGVIEAPRFQFDNFEIAKKHINALIYQIKNFNNKKIIIEECQKAFNQISKNEIEDYVNEKDFNLILNKDINFLYKSNIFPDYLFRKDEVKVYSIEAIDKKDAMDKKEYEISSSDLEMASREYVPGEIKYMSGEILKIVDNENSYDVVETILGKARRYKEIYVENAKGSISRKDSIKSHKVETLINFNNNKNIEGINKENIIKFFYYPNIELQFINNAQSNKQEKMLIAQILNRHAILINHDQNIISYKSMISFIALFDKAIKDLYGLDDDEIRIIYDDTKQTFALYDSNGNKNIDLKKIFCNLKEIIYYGYKKVKECSCEEINGCYLCMKSYNLNKYLGILNKNKAYKIAGYLIDKNRLPVDIQIEEEYDDIYDLEINVKLCGNYVEFIYDDKKYKKEIINKSQNEIIFEELTKIIKDLDEEIEYIKISSKIDYLIKAINNENDIKNSNGNFNKYNFVKLKYKNIYGEKI